MRIILILIIAFAIMLGFIKRSKAIILIFSVAFVPFLLSTLRSAFHNINNPMLAGNGLIALIILIGIFFAIFRIKKQKESGK
jgi:hypothetical protein